MRAGLSTIHQTLAPEAATILNQSTAEACRRNHGQTTPLHVAATLLSSPSGYLRQACIRSHPNSSHPLQCRALELCFSVALERLPTAQSMAPGMEPPISNALMAALKRAQAYQRRGCPEQQQQPLLAVKVELDQLIISILDDPSVSRVMREASFSSPAVKAAIEQSVSSSISLNPPQHHANFGPRIFPNSAPIDPFTNQSVYLNPRLQPSPAQKMCDEVNKVLEIMLRSKKRNPVLVGASEPEAVAREILRKVERKELGSDGILRNVEVISMEKGLSSDNNQISSKIKELGGMIESRIGSRSVILDLGDLKWLVASETGRTAVAEMAKLLARFRGDGGSNENKLWLIGTATCETYLRCQVYHSSMETDWDLQAVPMASRSILPRVGIPTASEKPETAAAWCPECSKNYEKEVLKLTTMHKSFSEATSLPQWLQNAKLNASQEKVQGIISSQKTTELQKKWRDICLHLHPNFHQSSRAGACRPGPPTLSMMNLHNLNPMSAPRRKVMQLDTDHATSPSPPAEASNPPSPPESPVLTDLVLGRKGNRNSAVKFTEVQAKDFLGCVSSQPRTELLDKFSDALDAGAYKKLLKALMEKAWWQAEAAARVAAAITRNGKCRGTASRGDVWLLFTGPDRVGKKKMAAAIAEQIFEASPVMICLGTRRDDEESDTNFRGKTAIDRIAEVVRRNPFSVIMLQDIDEADMLVCGSIKRAVERGRIADSHGREVSLGNAIFILSGDWSRAGPEASRDDRFIDEKKLASTAGGNWQLGLVVRERSSKRHAHWLQDDDCRPSKPRKDSSCGISLDLNLNLAAHSDDDRTDGSHGSSDLTNDHDEEFGPADRHVSQDLLNNVDEAIEFKAVESAFVRREIKKTISSKLLMMVDEKMSLEIEDDVLDKILGGLWHDRTSLQEWIDKVLEPSFDKLKPRLPSGGGRSSSVVVRLAVESHSGRSQTGGDWLPTSIVV